MAEKIVLYHNPRCSKSRAALYLLRDHPDLEVVEYLESPPDEATLSDLAAGVDGGARALLRTGEPAYAERGLDDPELDQSTLVRAIAEEPCLLNRPVARRGGRVVIGRPPENVLELKQDG